MELDAGHFWTSSKPQNQRVAFFCGRAGLKALWVYSLPLFHVHFYSTTPEKPSVNATKTNGSVWTILTIQMDCVTQPTPPPYARNKPTLSSAIDGLSVHFVSPFNVFLGQIRLILTGISDPGPSYTSDSIKDATAIAELGQNQCGTGINRQGSVKTVCYSHHYTLQ